MSYHYNGPGPNSPEGRQRMARDLKLISNPANWPVLELNLKTQPWRSAELGNMAFATIKAGELQVINKDTGVSRTYTSLEELVRDWSVD